MSKKIARKISRAKPSDSRLTRINSSAMALSVDDLRKLAEKQALERKRELEKVLEIARVKEDEYLSQLKPDTGREMTAAIIERYGDKPLSELIEDSQRPKSMLIYKMMANSGISYTTMAYYLMCTPQSLRNKLSRDSFSLDDLIAAANVCGYDLILRKKDGSEEITVDANDYFKNSEKNLEQWARLALLKEEECKRKAEEMAQLEERMQKLRNELAHLNKEAEQLRNISSHDS